MRSMMPFTVPDKTALEARRQLAELREERALCLLSPTRRREAELAELDADIEAAELEYVGLAVTELATLRGELGGTLQG